MWLLIWSQRSREILDWARLLEKRSLPTIWHLFPYVKASLKRWEPPAIKDRGAQWAGVTTTHYSDSSASNGECNDELHATIPRMCRIKVEMKRKYGKSLRDGCFLQRINGALQTDVSSQWPFFHVSKQAHSHLTQSDREDSGFKLGKLHRTLNGQCV